MTTIKLTNEEYAKMDAARQYAAELLCRGSIRPEDIEFIEEVLSMLESNCEHE